MNISGHLGLVVLITRYVSVSYCIRACVPALSSSADQLLSFSTNVLVSSQYHYPDKVWKVDNSYKIKKKSTCYSVINMHLESFLIV